MAMATASESRSARRRVDDGRDRPAVMTTMRRDKAVLPQVLVRSAYAVRAGVRCAAAGAVCPGMRRAAAVGGARR